MNLISQGPFVLGTVQLGHPYGVTNVDGLPSDRDARGVLDAARAAGLSHVDTARAYGVAEQRIGQQLARWPEGALGVVTKVRPLDALAEDCSAQDGTDEVGTSAAESLRALGANTVDAMLVHRARDWRKPGVRRGLLDLQARGMARAVGVSLGSPDDLLDLLLDPRCNYIQLPFNLLDRRWLDPDVQQALTARPDVIITVRSVYLQGLLLTSDASRWPINIEEEPASLMQALDSLCNELGRTSRADLCLAYVRAQPWVTSLVIGAETAAQVEDTAQLMQRPALAPDQVEVVHDRIPGGSTPLVDPSMWEFE